jgi:hypothetical protein
VVALTGLSKFGKSDIHRSAIALALLPPVRLLNLIKHEIPECDRSSPSPLKSRRGDGEEVNQIVSLLGGIFIQILR